jgi:signal transduction histidine kinase
LRKSGVASLAKVRGLLQEHASDLTAFLATDPKGKMVPGFIIHLSEVLEREQTALLDEHESVVRNVEHIKEIVAMQQNCARVSGLLEQVSIAQLLDDTLKTADLSRHGIEVIRHYSDVPLLTGDKHEVQQILVNLVDNAKNALDGTNQQNKRLIVGIGMNGDDRVKVTVADHGIGIAPENLKRIFSQGFTTRKGGHGFGLHSGANAAKEMGGQLTANSDGLGKGATFTLELPLTQDMANR